MPFALNNKIDIYIPFFHIAGQDESTLSPADSDSWLTLNPSQMDKLLGERWTDNSCRAEKQTSQSLRKKVQDFLSEKADVEGVQFFGLV